MFGYLQLHLEQFVLELHVDALLFIKLFFKIGDFLVLFRELNVFLKLLYLCFELGDRYETLFLELRHFFLVLLMDLVDLRLGVDGFGGALADLGSVAKELVLQVENLLEVRLIQ